MTKRQLIDEITHLNPTARPVFLADFDDTDLIEYLQHLRWLLRPGRKGSPPPQAEPDADADETFPNESPFAEADASPQVLLF